MAEHRRLVVSAAVALAFVAVFGGVYCAGWLRGSAWLDHRSHFKVLPTERLEYTATSWLGEAGTATVDVSPLEEHPDGSGTYRIIYTLGTSKKVSAIYVMKGQISATIDAKTLLPLEVEEKMRTGLAVKADDKHVKLVYDRAANVVKYYKRRRDDEEGTLSYKRSRPIPPDSHHFTSLLYFIRFMEFKPGRAVSVLMSDRKRDVTIKTEVLREREYDSPDGTKRAALVLQTVTDFGKEDIKGSTFTIWLDKKERYPVRVIAKLKWGTARLKLVKRTVGAKPEPETRPDDEGPDDGPAPAGEQNTEAQ